MVASVNVSLLCGRGIHRKFLDRVKIHVREVSAMSDISLAFGLWCFLGVCSSAAAILFMFVFLAWSIFAVVAPRRSHSRQLEDCGLVTV